MLAPAPNSAWWRLTEASLKAVRAAAPPGTQISVPQPWSDWLTASERDKPTESYQQPPPPDAGRVGKRIVWPISVRNGPTVPARVVTHPPVG
ncbi:hypothetical protein [Dactylosporangium sp. NPDC051484]|uniref:hypothetical protein n=1 Tax=Dactylosporangium sp. NPDC051484 TaxID=3154942 RepID=UPI00344B8C6F